MLRSAGFDRIAARLAPGRIRLAAGMLLATRPALASSPDSSRSDGTAVTATGRDAQSPHLASTYALLEGCVMQGLFAHVHASTRRTLARRGHEETAAPGQGCCGALHAHAGKLEAARKLARTNIEAFESSGAELVVTNSAGCGAALKEYPAWFRDDPELRSRASRFASKVRDISELLVESPPVESSAPSRPWPARQGSGRTTGESRVLRVAYDAPCHLLHAQGIRDAPLRALRESGYEVEPLPSSDRCCGGAGLYNLQQPELSDQVLERKLREIGEGEYQLVATGNPGCLMFLGSGLARAGMQVGVVHPVELVDLAEGNAEPGREVSRSYADQLPSTGNGNR